MSASSFTRKMQTYPGGFTNTIERFIFRKPPFTIITNGDPIGIFGSCGATFRSAIRYFNKWGWLNDSEREFFNQRTIQQLAEIR